MSWLKVIYEFIGTPYPRASLLAVMILAALLAGGVWLIVGRQVAKDHQAAIAPTQTTGPASTKGDNSPAVTGSGNNINYDHPVADKKVK